MFQEEEDDQVLLMITTREDENNADKWYLDIGCSTHMIGHKDWLVNLDVSRKRKVKFADDSTLSVEGIDNVMIQRKYRKSTMISKVL